MLEQGNEIKRISTHTLRGERDLKILYENTFGVMISTHTLRGERDTIFATASIIFFTFQLTRSVGSVTPILYSSTIDIDDFNSHAPWGA